MTDNVSYRSLKFQIKAQANYLKSLAIKRDLKTKSKTKRVPVIAISHSPYKNPLCYLKPCFTY
jgi:hypothetical protein